MGLPGLDIREAVMVDDLQDLRLLEAGHGLRDLVVIDQNDALSARLDEVIPGKRAHDLLVLVEDRIAAVTAFQDDLLHVVHKVGQMKRLKSSVRQTRWTGMA